MSRYQLLALKFWRYLVRCKIYHDSSDSGKIRLIFRLKSPLPAAILKKTGNDSKRISILSWTTIISRKSHQTASFCLQRFRRYAQKGVLGGIITGGLTACAPLFDVISPLNDRWPHNLFLLLMRLCILRKWSKFQKNGKSVNIFKTKKPAWFVHFPIVSIVKLINFERIFWKI